jgi:glycosyltransferase involved in cell wall biosynthesis
MNIKNGLDSMDGQFQSKLQRPERVKRNGGLMNILHFKPTMCLEEGGVVKAVLDLCTMSQENDPIGIVSFDPSGVPDSWLKDAAGSPRVYQLHGEPGPASTLKSTHKKQLREIVKQYDVVHLHSMWNLANPQVAKICTELGKPYVLSVHGMLDDWCIAQRKPKKMLYLKTWGRRLLKDAEAIHCTADAELRQASKWFAKSKGRVVPLPLDLSEYTELSGPELAYQSFTGLDRELPKVLFLSRIHYKKGVDRLIQASALLRERGVDHQLVIAGTGDSAYVDEMKSLVRSVGIEDSTYFLGFATGQAKISLFEACDVFALPTSQENFGFVFFEALATGTVVLTTKGTDTWSEIEQSGAGVIAENTPEAFAVSLDKILQRKDVFQAKSAQAREWVWSNFSADQVREGYNTLYSNCVKSVNNQ